MPVTGIDHVYLASDDFDASWKFWTELVGAEATRQWGKGDHKAGIVMLGGSKLVLAQEEKGSHDDLGYTIEHGRPQLFYKVSGIASLFEQVKARGAEVVRPLHKTHWGPMGFSVLGPNGIVVAFVE